MPQFKKVGGKIYGVTFNKKEQEAIDQEICRQLKEASRQDEIDRESCILWMLHVHFGFGPRRLRKAWELFYQQNHELTKRYDLPTDDGPWICRQKLLDYGINLEEWFKEE